MLKNFLFVAIGGASGAALRYAIVLVGSALGLSGHLATFIINALGSFCLGLLTSSCQPGSLTLFAAVGLCGAFTTFSTYSAQSVDLLQHGRFGAAALYILGTVTVCLLCAWLGFATGHRPA